jgi:hypothetical protein
MDSKNRKQINHIKAFVQLGIYLEEIAISLDRQNPSALNSDVLRNMYHAAVNAENENAWFTRESVIRVLKSLAYMLRPDAFEKWLINYPDLKNPSVRSPSLILVIMAGNIPLVGFHDMLCVLVSGHHLTAKLSSQDTMLPKALGNLLIEIEPSLANKITFIDGPVTHFDAVIATGSNNSSRYFDYYFGKYPHIIRKNRSSMAVCSGGESTEELIALGDDVFSYFGLGCRNVSMVFIPEQFDLTVMFDTWKKYDKICMHSKYMNNYDYQKAIMMVNKISFTDVGFCLLKEDTKLQSPVSVIHYQRYSNLNDVMNFIKMYQNDLQCVVASPNTELSQISTKKDYLSYGIPKEFNYRHPSQQLSTIPPGSSQKPELWDYADGADTMEFLCGL